MFHSVLVQIPGGFSVGFCEHTGRRWSDLRSNKMWSLCDVRHEEENVQYDSPLTSPLSFEGLSLQNLRIYIYSICLCMYLFTYIYISLFQDIRSINHLGHLVLCQSTRIEADLVTWSSSISAAGTVRGDAFFLDMHFFVLDKGIWFFLGGFKAICLVSKLRIFQSNLYA